MKGTSFVILTILAVAIPSWFIFQAVRDAKLEQNTTTVMTTDSLALQSISQRLDDLSEKPIPVFSPQITVPQSDAALVKAFETMGTMFENSRQSQETIEPILLKNVNVLEQLKDTTVVVKTVIERDTVQKVIYLGLDTPSTRQQLKLAKRHLEKIFKENKDKRR